MTDDHDSDNESRQRTLIESISSLNNAVIIKKPRRTEPSITKNEYGLVKVREKHVNVKDLVTSLQKKNRFKSLEKTVNRLQRRAIPVKKPLEKPVAERVQRKLGFDNVKKVLDEWEPVIQANRVTEQLVFPLPTPKELVLYRKSKQSKDDGPFRIKTAFEEQLESVGYLEKQEQTQEDGSDDEPNFTLTMEELREKRRELARYRARQSYEEAKARRLRKIKSKKFHRVAKRAKFRQQIKDFEKLQKDNPEEALEKLNDIERARVMERMTLRHKSTGQWAKNQAIRAKYDKQTRQELSEQLKLSKEITQKVLTHESDDDMNVDDGEEDINAVDQDGNPWMNKLVSGDVKDFVSGYRKFWEEKNKHDELKIRVKDQSSEKNTENTEVINPKILEDVEKNSKKIISKPNSAKNLQKPEIVVKSRKKIERKIKNKPDEPQVEIMSGWCVTSVKPLVPKVNVSEKDIDELFDAYEIKLEQKSTKKLKKIQSQLKLQQSTQSNKTPKIKLKKSKKAPGLEMKPKKLRIRIDEEMDERAGRNENDNEVNNEKNIQLAKKLIKKSDDNNQSITPTEIDTNKIIKLKPTNLSSLLPDGGVASDFLDDQLDEPDQQALLEEAFEDADIIDEFAREKEDEIEKSTVKPIDLSLPGWGSWAGSDIKQKSKKPLSLLLKPPPKEKRRDDNKGNLIIKERKGDEKLRQHQVNDVQFPFKTVKDFEASIRAPIGDTFVPEKVFRKLIAPKVVTRAGVAIEPIDQDHLLAKKDINDNVKLRIRQGKLRRVSKKQTVKKDRLK